MRSRVRIIDIDQRTTRALKPKNIVFLEVFIKVRNNTDLIEGRVC